MPKELSIAETNEILNNARELVLQLLVYYPDGLVSVIDGNFNFVLTGGELHKRLGVDPKSLIGNPVYPKFPEMNRKSVIEKLDKVFSGDVIADFTLPEKMKGEWYVMDAYPIREKNHSIVYAGVIIRNVTRLKLAEEELKKALKKERELGELKSRFVTMASHEFRTPLTTVLSSANLLKKYADGDNRKNMEKHISKIVSSVNLMNDILNDFLSIGKIEEGRVVAKPVRVNIREITSTAIQELSGMQKEGQQVLYQHQGEEYTALDPVLLRHIINNLLSNAIKFSQEHSIINIDTCWQDGNLKFKIKDQGIGIPKESQDHLFERFYRGSNVINIQGTGLGLHIVGRYLELMNASIEYKTELYKGTSFTITF